MNSCPSPLQSLAAFAIVFASGILSAIGLGLYIQKLKTDIKQEQNSDVHSANSVADQ